MSRTCRDPTADVSPPSEVSLGDWLRALSTKGDLSQPLVEPVLRETIHRFLT